MALYWSFLLPSFVCLAFTCFNQCFLKNRNIKEIKSLDSDVISEVLSHGCRKTRDMIELASGKSGEEISELLQIKEADAQKLCALCHLMRLPGVKDTRAGLYYDSGL